MHSHAVVRCKSVDYCLTTKSHALVWLQLAYSLMGLSKSLPRNRACWVHPQVFGRYVICCVFTKSSFWLHSYFDVLCTSNLFLTQLHTCLLSFIIIQVAFIFLLIFYLFSVLSINSVLLPFDHLLSYSLIILCTWYLFIILCLCMWISLACDFLCALLHPSLPFPYHILWYFLCLILLLSPLLWLLCMSPTPYIISYSPVLVL